MDCTYSGYFTSCVRREVLGARRAQQLKEAVKRMQKLQEKCEEEKKKKSGDKKKLDGKSGGGAKSGAGAKSGSAEKKEEVRKRKLEKETVKKTKLARLDFFL